MCHEYILNTKEPPNVDPEIAPLCHPSFTLSHSSPCPDTSLPSLTSSCSSFRFKEAFLHYRLLPDQVSSSSTCSLSKHSPLPVLITFCVITKLPACFLGQDSTSRRTALCGPGFVGAVTGEIYALQKTGDYFLDRPMDSTQHRTEVNSLPTMDAVGIRV